MGINIPIQDASWENGQNYQVGLVNLVLFKDKSRIIKVVTFAIIRYLYFTDNLFLFPIVFFNLSVRWGATFFLFSGDS